MCVCVFWPAVTFKFFRLISAVEEFSLEKLHSHDSKDEHEEHVDDKDVQDVFQRVHHAVEHSLNKHISTHDMTTEKHSTTAEEHEKQSQQARDTERNTLTA